MKLHLPVSFRKALLACLASIIVPAVTLASGASAFDLTPTLGSDSAYSIEPATEEETDAFCIYEIDDNGDRLPKYYKVVVKAAPQPDFSSVRDDIYLHWVKDVTSGVLRLEESDANSANLLYTTEKNASGQHTTFPKKLEIGDGDKEIMFSWIWEGPNASISNDRSISRWILSSKGTSNPTIVYRYVSARENDYGTSSRVVVGVGEEKDDIFYNFTNQSDKSNTGSSINSTAKGGAISNEGTIDNIKGNFTANSAFASSLTDIANGAPNVKHYVMGGAIYNGIAGNDITNVEISTIEGYFSNNSASITHKGTTVSDRGYDNYYASGGAIFNGVEGIGYGNDEITSHISSINGSFINNHSSIDRFSFTTGNHLNYAMGGAISNSIENIDGNSASIASGIDSISGKFIGNYALNQSNQHATVGLHFAFGGAIFNGFNEISNSSSSLSSSIGALTGDFVGNYVETKMETSGANTSEWVSANRPIKFYAFGGAIYNGIENAINAGGTIQASISEKIQGNFIDNHAYIWHKTQLQYDANGSNLLVLKSYVYGGAIYNGIIDIEGTINNSTSELADITGSFIGNYVHNETPITSASGSNSGTGDRFTDQRNFAFGGAIYNGLSDVNAIKGNATAAIGDIIGDFVGNFAHTENHYSCAYVKSSGFQTLENKSIMTNYAFGGAIYNGIGEASDTKDSSITASVNSVTGNFVGNYAFLKRTSYKEYPFEKTNSVSGGAIYNGIMKISGEAGTIKADILDGIVGVFTDNYVYVTSNSSTITSYAVGGAIYNGIERINADSGSISSEISLISASNNYIKGNYSLTDHYTSVDSTRIYRYDYALGGAVANSISSIEYNNATLSSSVTDIKDIKAFVDNYTCIKSTTTSNYNYAYPIKTVYAMGGAVYNGVRDVTVNKGMLTSHIGNISADLFVGNHAEVKDEFVFNTYYSSHPTIMAWVVGSDNTNRTNYAFGGAIYNGIQEIKSNENKIVSSINSISGNFIDNYALVASGFSVSDTLQSKYDEGVTSTSPTINRTINSYSMGGAIYNGIHNIDSTNAINTDIQEIKGDFIRNRTYFTVVREHEKILYEGTIRQNAYGGAIYNGSYNISLRAENVTSSINLIDGNFDENSASSNYNAKGGAIYNGVDLINSNSGTITSSINHIIGNFTNNYAEGKFARGGAIYNGTETLDGNTNTVNITIGKIYGDFIDNSAKAPQSGSDAMGGAIYNSYGTITDITGDFVRNETRCDSSSSNAHGGAIYNSFGEITSITGHFINNSSSSTYMSQGGAIFNGIAKFTKIENSGDKVATEIKSISGNFIDNVSKGNNLQYASGGAIANTIGYLYLSTNNGVGDINNLNGTFTISIGRISDGDFTGNYAESSASIAFGGSISNGILKFENGPSKIFDNRNGHFELCISEIESSFIENHSKSSKNFAFGGAIANGIGFLNNGSYSGLINNQEGRFQFSIGNIIGKFIDNYAVTSYASTASSVYGAKGGAIYNGFGDISNSSDTIDNTRGTIASTIDTISGDFIRNYAKGDAAQLGYNVYSSPANGGAIYNGIGKISSSSKEFYNTEGHFEVSIGNITAGDFKDNYAESKSAHANGGAIFNGIESIENRNAETNNSKGFIVASITSVTGNFTNNQAVSEPGNANGGAIYNGIGTIANNQTTASNATIFNNNDGTIQAYIGSITGNFTNNKALSTTASAKGGAIYNDNGSYSSQGVPEFSNVNGTIEAVIGDITGNFIGNEVAGAVESKGGAIYNTGRVGDIAGDFETNQAESQDGASNGGAIYNTSIVGNITGDFTKNTANTTAESAHGGAIYNTGSVGNITGEFTGNEAAGAVESKGGAIYNEGSMGLISTSAGPNKSGFSGNKATTSGGAIQNEGSIAGIVGENFTGNSAAELGSAVTNIGTIGKIGADATSDREYDNTLTGGIINSSFTGNTGAGAKAALYTETSLAIIADKEQSGNADVVFSGNKNSGKESDIYVAAGQDGDMPEVYMVAKKGASIATHGEIDGDAEYMLRLRGFTEKADELYATHGGANNSNPQHEENGDKSFPGGGLIHFRGTVKNADVIMDDVTLKLGTAKTGETYLSVYEDTIARRNDDHELHPGEILFTGEGGDVEYTWRDPLGETYQREYSDVLRDSRLEVRSGHVLANEVAADGGLINYNFGTLVTYGNLSYDPSVENGGYYTDGSVNKDWTIENKNNPLYGTWSVSISLNQLNANTITAWWREDDPRRTRGYVTLSGITVLTNYTACDKDTAPFEDWWKEQVENDNISPYLDVTIQVINLLREGENGREEMADNDPWREEGDINHSAPLQLDLSLLKQKHEASAFMDSNDILAEGFGYATTKTYHDSIRIWGWRDNLAAWSELQLKAKESGAHGYEKEFHIIGTQYLTRNIQRKENASLADTPETLLQGSNLIIYGNGIGASVLNVNGFNLLSEVAAGQTVELKDMSIVNVGESRTENHGTLIMDTLSVEDKLKVINDSEVIKRGDWGISNIFTSSQSGADVDNRLRLQDGKTEILGTVEHQNIEHETAGAYTTLLVNEQADSVKNNAESLWTGGETGQFLRFADNSLTMTAGDFHLMNLNSSELILRDFNMDGGTLHVNNVTVNLADKAGIKNSSAQGAEVEGWNEGHMGMIWATEHAEAATDGTGKIWVGNVTLRPKDGKADRIPVQFVNPEVGATVVPFGNKGEDYSTSAVDELGHNVSQKYAGQFTAKYEYTVYYDYTMGQYVYELVKVPSNDGPVDGTPVLNPSIQAGPVSQMAGGFVGMAHTFAHAFEHANLFSSYLYGARKSKLYEETSYTIITPVKGGKNAVSPVKGYKGGRGGGAVATQHSVARRGSRGCADLAGFRGGMWVRPYGSYERMPLRNGPKVHNYQYGALVGGDTELTEHNNGWASVYSAYIGYMGSTQKFSRKTSSVRAQQNGATVGATATFYHKGFYTALTASAGTGAVHANTMFGSENYHMFMAGVASQTGYNIEFGNGKYVLQPTLQVSYTLVDMNTYTEAAGVRMKSTALQVVQLHPFVRLTMDTDSCWKPYLTLGYVHNFVMGGRFRADGELLPGLGLRPYGELSIGVQRTWNDTYTLYGEATGRHGSRNGVELSTGIRWCW